MLGEGISLAAGWPDSGKPNGGLFRFSAFLLFCFLAFSFLGRGVSSKKVKHIEIAPATKLRLLRDSESFRELSLSPARLTSLRDSEGRLLVR